MEPVTSPVSPLAAAKERIEQRKRIEAIQGFEEMFLNEMLKSMRKTIPESEEGGQSKALWRERFDAEIAHKVAESGGIGLAKMLEPRMGTAAKAPEKAPGKTK